ncbi:hypothetical protein ACFOUV_02620 [Oceanobacillus longus]|uniref:Phage protein n=1 Tax=Oceanobacillus longus TaxID=930120 RepID=A0ABV8GSJ9_9BACI
MNYKEVDTFIDDYYNVPNVTSLPEDEQKEIHNLTFKQWKVQAMVAETIEDQAKKQRLIDNIVQYKSEKWGVVNGE